MFYSDKQLQDLIKKYDSSSAEKKKELFLFIVRTYRECKKELNAHIKFLKERIKKLKN